MLPKTKDEVSIEIWNTLNFDQKCCIKEAFINNLTYRYHKTFFKKLPFEYIIKERWFLYFLSSYKNPLEDLWGAEMLDFLFIDAGQGDIALMAV